MRGCPDDGACHHGCAEGHCFRVRTCAPLSGVFPGDRWPDEVREQLGGPGDAKLEDLLVQEVRDGAVG